VFSGAARAKGKVADMKKPPVASFDSSAAMLKATARYLQWVAPTVLEPATSRWSPTRG
jgi:hypothetical protein